jgi:hypothetical protein
MAWIEGEEKAEFKNQIGRVGKLVFKEGCQK